MARFAIFLLCSLVCVSPTKGQNTGYWNGANRNFSTTKFGNVAATAAHNCYFDQADNAKENLDRTLAKIHAAQNDGADLIELDIRGSGKNIYVAHDDDKKVNQALLSDVLADAKLKSGDQVLFIELKEDNPNATFARILLNQVADAGYATTGRPVVFRAFDSRRRNLLLLKSVLKQNVFDSIRDNIKFHEFLKPNGPGDEKAFHSRILRVRKAGFDGVEFRYDTANLFAAIGYAKSLGLGVGLFTIPQRFGEVFIAGLREDVDALVVDYPVRNTRLIVEEDNGLIHLNTFDLPAKSRAITYSSAANSGTGKSSVLLSAKGSPIMRTLRPGNPTFGTTMAFNRGQSVSLFDADNRNGQGYLISTCVRFSKTNFAEGEMQSVFAKSDNGGFSLEMYNTPGEIPTQLRFGVRVGSSYVYATYPASELSTASHFIIAAYDGDGNVRMWIDGSEDKVTSTGAVGEVIKNDSPVTIGADPQGPEVKRFFFQGEIQQVQLQSWGNH